MTNEDSYECDRCGDIYLFDDAYDSYKTNDGELIYLIHGWYGGYDGQDMCERCWDAY